MRKIDNLLTQKKQLEVKVRDLQLQIKLIEERVTLLQEKYPESVKTTTLPAKASTDQ